MEKHLVWLLGTGVGILSYVFYALVLFFTNRFLLSALAVILLVIVCAHCIFHFFIQPSKRHVYMIAVTVALTFEFVTVFTTALFPDENLPSLTTFIFTYVSIFVTTMMIIPLLIAWGLFLHYNFFAKMTLYFRRAKKARSKRIEH